MSELSGMVPGQIVMTSEKSVMSVTTSECRMRSGKMPELYVIMMDVMTGVMSAMSVMLDVKGVTTGLMSVKGVIVMMSGVCCS